MSSRVSRFFSSSEWRESCVWTPSRVPDSPLVLILFVEAESYRAAEAR